jgi:hypothetical protein
MAVNCVAIMWARLLDKQQTSIYHLIALAVHQPNAKSQSVAPSSIILNNFLPFSPLALALFQPHFPGKSPHYSSKPSDHFKLNARNFSSFPVKWADRLIEWAKYTSIGYTEDHNLPITNLSTWPSTFQFKNKKISLI